MRQTFKEFTARMQTANKETTPDKYQSCVKLP